MPENYLVVASTTQRTWVSRFQAALQEYGKLEVISGKDARSTRTFSAQEIVIIDGNVKDSLSLVRRCHHENPTARIYMAAATPTWQFNREALRAGANKVIEKQLGKSEIIRTVIEPTILFADNKLEFRETRAHFLKEEGYNVVMAGSPEEATDHLSSMEVDLAILDIRLKNDNDDADQSGLEAARAAKPGVPIIFLTNFPAPDLVNRALGRSRDRQPLAEEFFDKREDPEELLKAVKRLLTVSRERRKAASATAGTLGNRQTVREILEDLVRGPVLDNFEGFVCARIRQDGSSGEISVWVQADSPGPEILSDAIHIRDGQDSPEVTFDIQVESEDLHCLRRRASLVAEPGKRSRVLTFPLDQPLVPEGQDVWIQVFQKNRLIQVLSAQVKLVAEEV